MRWPLMVDGCGSIPMKMELVITAMRGTDARVATARVQPDRAISVPHLSRCERVSQEITQLAIAQLAAYNRADLTGFCACYHLEVVVLDAQGQVTLSGLEAFRERYAPMFARGGFGAEVPQRLSAGDHCVDLEHYWRDDPEQGQTRGTLLVRYQLREGLIGLVQFLR